MEVPIVEAPADPKPPEAGATPAPKTLLVSKLALPVEPIAEGNGVGLNGDPRPAKGLASVVLDVAPNVPNGEVEDLERAAKPEAAKAEGDVWGLVAVASEANPEEGFESILVLVTVAKGETFDVSEKPLAGST